MGWAQGRFLTNDSLLNTTQADPVESKTLPTAKLFGNQVFAGENVHDFGRSSIGKSTTGCGRGDWRYSGTRLPNPSGHSDAGAVGEDACEGGSRA